MSPNGYQVRTKVFEGPLEILLDLIERRKLHINDISLSGIADDYLAYMEKLKEFPTKDAAQFLVVASTLVLIKSRTLLPSLSLTNEEQESISDLEGRLKLLKRARELAAIIGGRLYKTPLYYRDTDYQRTPVFSPHTAIEKQNLLSIIREILKNLPKRELVPQVIVKKVISMEEMMNNLTERIKQALSVSFHEFAKNGGGDKTKLVISFLAILELVKRGIISVRQNEQFEDIEIEGMEVTVPRYY